MYAFLSDSKSKNKKYSVMVVDDLDNPQKKKLIQFGDNRYEDYTIHLDKLRKLRYLKRHSRGKKEDWNNPYTAGFWSRWLLWNKPSIDESADDIYSRFGIEILYM